MSASAGRVQQVVVMMLEIKQAFELLVCVRVQVHEMTDYIYTFLHQPRAFETRLVKYFNKGVATVREKRLALEGEARGDTPPTPPEVKMEQAIKYLITPCIHTVEKYLDEL